MQTHPLLRFPQRQRVSRLGVSRMRRQPGRTVGADGRLLPPTASSRRSRRSHLVGFAGWRPRQVLRSRTPPGVPPERSGVPDSPVARLAQTATLRWDPPGQTFAPHTLSTLAAARSSGQDRPLRPISRAQHTLQRRRSQEAFERWVKEAVWPCQRLAGHLCPQLPRHCVTVGRRSAAQTGQTTVQGVDAS